MNPHIMQAMMKRGRIAQPLRLRAAQGDGHVVPPGECWVLERSAWVLLMWRAPSGPTQLELPLRDYAHHLSLGDISLSVAR
jgi:hypothetical protein